MSQLQEQRNIFIILSQNKNIINLHSLKLHRMNYTEPQLQSALVRALPDKLESDIIRHRAVLSVWWLLPDGTGDRPVTPHEWPAIVGMVEDGLTQDETSDQYLAYWTALEQRSKCTNYDLAGEARKVISAKWQTRAAALADIGAIKVEENK